MKCSVYDCHRTASGNLWQGKPYCRVHYDELMYNAFENVYSCWEKNTQPSHELRSIFGRFVDEKWEMLNGLMSKARIRDRAFNFQKEEAGFTFEITRHPGAFERHKVYDGRRIVQRWRVSLHEGVVELMEERAWTQDDPE